MNGKDFLLTSFPYQITPENSITKAKNFLQESSVKSSHLSPAVLTLAMIYDQCTEETTSERKQKFSKHKSNKLCGKMQDLHRVRLCCKVT